ncbi:TIGR04282 family arsenosugar biosynthesis glycosyltransferase [Methylobacter sp.]|uniref:TIGR04282 family arsenosugar biosynthesis glycosyltransferase n=1 Tax=Methylobacter sp. TaxID=2051955 RepID=UPI0024870820|nr:TIGR04282 family arsenosugar biosynthesis glycosyltransferase [Methylobacter sp.]MDI1277752.1 TIGR04282 family arsenosugar biosynthesis glycosyltransferase [Methylobacter sp.]MDI1358346.1 TIGR04282 family arsenosugar biosynthesis glycosyltransferase [Methylobacter sp.]
MTYKYPNAVLMIFCKAPIPSQVKTRLIPELTAEQAAELHIELSIKTLQRATESNLCPVQLWCSPTTDHAFFTASKAAYPLILRQQQGADLGERMHHAFCSGLADYSSALLMGCDCPSITEQDLEEALAALNQENEVVLAPAEDGGYVLIGLNRPHSELFDNMPWGTARVLDQTRNRIEHYKLRHHELSEQWDLDTPEDMERYRVLALNMPSG